MTGLGTIINTAGILVGGAAGLLFGRGLGERFQKTLNMACGVSVLFIGIAGAMEGMLSIDGGALTSAHSMLLVLCLADQGSQSAKKSCRALSDKVALPASKLVFSRCLLQRDSMS